MRVLLTTPYRPTTPAPLVANWREQASALIRRAAHLHITAYLHEDTAPPPALFGRFSAHAQARNAVLDRVDLQAYDYIYWCDIDILRWPVGLLSFALAANPDGVTGCAVTLDHQPSRFYDIWGFLEDGKPARLQPPWFDQQDRVIALESVGCCYVVPAVLYRDGARYADTPGATEHLSVCQAARSEGRSVIANMGIRAVHAWLPDYGEAVH